MDAKGEGGTQRSNSSASQAVTGSINAANGINVNVKQDAVYQGTALNGGSGKTTVNAGGDIRFDQASDKQSENHSGFNVKASAKGGFTADSKTSAPASAAAPAAAKTAAAPPRSVTSAANRAWS